MIKRIRLNTKKRHEVINLTSEVKKAVKESGINNGLCNVYTRHTTAAITINENDDPKVQEDILNFMKGLVQRGVWGHDKSGGCDRENGDAHIKSALLSHGGTIPIENGELLLGTWQDIFFCEFDGPRNEREIVITLIKDK